jgi:hypothetical protein
VVPPRDIALMDHPGDRTYGALPAGWLSVLSAPAILTGTVLAQLADALTFTIGVGQFGIALESNSLAVTLYRTNGLDGVLLAKGAAILLSLAILVLAAHRFPRLLFFGGAAATSIGLLGFVTNTLSILILS